jgi:hypothetical protein
VIESPPTLLERLQARWLGLPLGVRKFIVDVLETAGAALVGVSLTIPADLTQAQAQAVVIASAVAGAVIAVVRRHLPGWIAALRAAFPASLL